MAPVYGLLVACHYELLEPLGKTAYEGRVPCVSQALRAGSRGDSAKRLPLTPADA